MTNFLKSLIGGKDLPLHQAVKNEDIEKTRALIMEGADVNARSKEGATPLHFAGTHPEIAKLLISAGADVNAKEQSGQSPLHVVIATGSREYLEKLPAVGNDDIGKKVLEFMLLSSFDVIKILIAAGADVNAKNDLGVTPLFIASRFGDAEIMKSLIKAGADVILGTADGMSPLLAAIIYSKDIEAIRILIDAGADIDAKDYKGRTPLHAAMSDGGNIQIVKVLIAAGADLTVKTEELSTYLHSAVAVGDVEIIEAFIAAGIDVNAKDQHGVTPLMLAIHFQNERAKNALIKGGAKS